MNEIEDQLQRYGAAVEREMLSRADDAPEPGAASPRRRRVLTIAAAIAALAVSAGTFWVSRSGDDGVQVATTTVVPSIVTDETEPAEAEPTGVFGTATDSVLLFSDGIDGVTAIDLDRRLASRRVVEGALAGDPRYTLTRTAGRFIVGWGEVYAASLDDTPSVKIADTAVYTPAAEEGEVWVVSWDDGRLGIGSSTLQRVRVDGMVTYSSPRFDLTGLQPVLGVPGGLAGNMGVGVAVWDAESDGTGSPLGPGPAVAISSDGRSLAWCRSTCAETHVVELEKKGAATGPFVSPGDQQIALSPDGDRLAVLRPVGDSAQLVVVDRRTSEEVVIARDLNEFGALQWAQDGRQLFYTDNWHLQTTRIGRYETTEHTWELASVPVGDVQSAIVLDRDETAELFSTDLVPAAACPGAGGTYPSGREGTCTFAFESDLPELEKVGSKVIVETTKVTGGDNGTTEVVMEFDRPLPNGDVRYVEDIRALGDVDEIVYTIQHARSVHVCDSVHSFPPPAEGTIDLLIPADWFAEVDGAHTSELDLTNNPAKFVVCGPHERYFQYSIWGPESVDLDSVTVEVDAARTRLSVEIEPGEAKPSELAPDVAAAAEALVLDFLDDLRRGDLDAAARKWNGYPETNPEASATDRVPFIEALLSDSAFASLLEADVQTFVNASSEWPDASPVVTVLAPAGAHGPAVAVGFLVGDSDLGYPVEGGEPDQMWIYRLPSVADRPDEVGSVVEPGEEIVLPTVPVEGVARAYLNGTEIPATVDYTGSTTSIQIPDSVEGTVAITVSLATPELSAVRAFALTIGDS